MLSLFAPFCHERGATDLDRQCATPGLARMGICTMHAIQFLFRLNKMAAKELCG
jgi:Leu/Phe-tRNA-protein transferase